MTLCPEGKSLRADWYEVCQVLEPETVIDETGIAGMRLAPDVLSKIQRERRNSAARQYHFALYAEHLGSCEVCDSDPKLYDFPADSRLTARE